MSPLRSYILPMLLVLLTLRLVWPAFAHAIEVWSTDEEFSFGFLVPVVSLGLIAFQWRALRASAGPGHRAGLLIVAVSLAVYLLGYRVGLNALAGLAISPLLWGGAIALWGWPTGRLLAFPIGFLAFGLALFRGLLDTVGFTMQGLTAVGAALLGRGLGLPIVRDGLILYSDRYAFQVAQQCSGMSSLVSLLALAALWTYVARGSVPGRIALLVSVLPLVMLANTARVTLVLLVAAWLGEEAALGFFHGLSSLVLFGLALGGMLAIGRAVGCRLPTPAA